MPTYEYFCESCGHELELFQSITAAPKRKCPACKKSKLKRKIGGGSGFLFKGSGFYLTDYRSDSYKKAAEADSKPATESNTASKPDKDSGSSNGKDSSKSAAPVAQKKDAHEKAKTKKAT